MKKLKKALCLVLSLIFCMGTLCACQGTADALQLNKSSYYMGEEILVTAEASGSAWVGIYRKNDDINSVDAIAWYYVAKDGHISGEQYVFQKNATYNSSRVAYQNLPNGKYKAVLFKSATSKDVISTVSFTILKEDLGLPSAPSSMELSLDDETSGLANGTITFTFDDNYTASDIIMYWANSSGILSDYTALATIRVTSSTFTYEMYENTIIPENATKLIAYGSNSVGISSNYCEVELPVGCGLDFSGEVITEFQVVSDVHITISNSHLASSDAQTLHDEHFLAMLNDIADVSPNSSGIIINGDIANSGSSAEWEHALELIASVKGLPQVYYSIGNHDLYTGSYDEQVEYFYTYANVNSVYYDVTIGGYTHIFLGSESSTSSVDADLSTTQLEWFENKLEELTAEDPSNPIFVYLHQSLYDTVAGSFEGQGWDGVIQDAELRAIIEKYPQIYLFNGHSHWDLNTRGSMVSSDKNLPYIFNTASVAYLWSSYYVPTGEYLQGSQGYYVYVYADKILVLGRDFTTKQWIPSACFATFI